MVRTGDRCVRIGGGKSSAKKGGGGASSGSTPKSKSSSSKSNSSIGGNPVCPRETPNWQKPITSFFQKRDPVESSNNDDESRNSEVSCSKDIVEESADNKSPEHTVNSNNLPVKEASPKNDVNNKLSTDEIPSTSGNKTLLEECEPDRTNGNQSICKTPTSERKRKSNINILTPKRIQSHS